MSIIIIIGLSLVCVLSLIGFGFQTFRMSKVKIAGIQADTVLKEANRQADKVIRDAKFQVDKDTKAMVRRAEDDIAFKKRQMQEVEKELNTKKSQIGQQKKEQEKLQAQFEEKLDGIKQLRKKQDEVLQELFA